MVVGAVLMLLGPIVGLLLTVWSLNRSFESTKSGAIAPENKARHLADGISSGMNYTAIGIGVAIVGMICLAVFAFVFARARNARGVTSDG
jgi:biopolymer transport protein ExbB/TolQ